MKKNLRGVCFLLCLCVITAVFTGCGEQVQPDSSSDVNIEYADTLAGLNVAKDTGLARYSEVFESPVMVEGRVWALGWSWQQTDGTQDPQMLPLLLSATTDGSDPQTITLQIPKQQPEEGWSEAVTTEALLPHADGTMQLLTASIRYPTDDPDGIASVDASRTYYIHTLGASGEFLQTEAIPSLEGCRYIYAATVANDSVWVLTDSAVVCLTPNMRGKVFALPQELALQNFCVLETGEILLFGYNGGVFWMDANGQLNAISALPETLDPAVALHPVQQQNEQVSDTVLVWDGNGIYRWDRKNNTTESLFPWLDGGVDVTLLLEVFALDGGRFLAVSKNEQTSALEFLQLTPASPELLASRTVVTLGTAQSLSKDIARQILAFNNAQAELFVKVIDYSVYGDGSALMENDIITGNAPDILLLPVDITTNSYVRKGLFADLYPLLDADPELDRSDFIDGVLAAGEFNGELSTVAVAYEVFTLVGSAEKLGKQPGWTWEEFAQVCSTEPGLVTPIHRWNRNTVLLYHLQMGGDLFIDYKNGTANLNSAQFIQLLEESAGYPEEIGSADLPKEDFASGKSLLFHCWLSNFEQIRELYYIFDGEIAYKGYPGTSGCGSAVIPRVRLGITSNCKNVDAAWSFLRQLLLPEYQNTLSTRDKARKNTSYFPLRKDSLLAAAQEAMQPVEGEYIQPANVDLSGMNVQDPFWTQGLSQAQCDQLIQLIESIQVFYQYDSVVDGILQEEASAYYSGACTAETAAKLMQNRIQLYLDEQG